KDMGSPFRALTPDERAIFQSVIDELQRQFVAKVVERRRLPESAARGLADGRIYTAPQALEKGLVDAIGYMPDALAAARRAIGVEDAKVIVYKRPREYQATYYAQPRTEARGLDATLGQQVRELNVWHTEVEPQTVKTIQDTSIAEFERKFPGFKVKQQALGWGDLNTKLLASLAAGSPPDLTHLNPFMTASLYVKNLLRPMDELIRALGENDIHEATLKLQYFDGKYYGVTHAMGATYFAERRDLREKKGIKPPETYADMLKLAEALTEGGRYALQMPGEKLYIGFVHPAEWLASNGG